MSENIEKIRSILGKKYKIDRLINKGGMGEIYLGVHQALNRRVAIKIIHQELGKDENFRKRFYQEAKLAAKLDHSGIIDIYDFGTEDDFDYIIMPFIDGSTLEEKIKQEGKLEVQECLRLMISVVDAVSYAHKNNVIHRDIKPSNIMINKQGKAIITDFGISKDLGDVGLTTVGMVLGSPKYMSPEQVKGQNIDTRCDLYSLGLVFYELITAKYPFEGKDATSIYYFQAHEMPQRPEEYVPDVPGQVGDIIMKLLEKSPERRYQDGYQLLKDLESCKADFDKDSRISEADTVIVSEEATEFYLPEEKKARDLENLQKDLSQNQRSFTDSTDRPEKKQPTFKKNKVKWWIIPVVGVSLIVVLGIVGIVWIARSPDIKEAILSKIKPQGPTTSEHIKKIESAPSETLEKSKPEVAAETLEKPKPEVVAKLDQKPDKTLGSEPSSFETSEITKPEVAAETLEKPKPEVVAKLDQRPDKTLGSEPSFDYIVKSLLTLGQEREATFLKLWVDKPRFRNGDTISYHFQSDKPCYLVMLVKTSEGDLIQIFPNKFNLNQLVQAKKQYTIPGDQTGIELEVTGRPGVEEVVALVAKKPFDLLAANFDEQPFFQVAKEGKALFEKIAKNIQETEELNLAQKRLNYSIVD